RLIQKIKINHTLLFYFIGHGGSINKKPYIYPQDAILDEGEYTLLKESSIALNWFDERLIAKSAHYWNNFFIIDACRHMLVTHSAGEGDTNEDEEIISRMEQPDLKMITRKPRSVLRQRSTQPVGTSYFFSCSPMKKGYSFKNEEDETCGIFGSAFVETMRQGLSRQLTYGMLIKNVKKRVGEITESAGGINQIPYELSTGLEAYKKVLLGSKFDPEPIPIPLTPPRPPPVDPDPDPVFMEKINPAFVRELIDDALTTEEIKDICFDFGFSDLTEMYRPACIRQLVNRSFISRKVPALLAKIKRYNSVVYKEHITNLENI
ncbi:MAG: caspase family protein, partial [Candidatus Hermodarchaeota archaeon]